MPFPPDGPRLPKAAPATSALPLRGITLLAVEDSRFACDALRLICQRSGARLRRAETIAAARKHLALHRPDLVIVDLGLPDGRGEVLVAEIAANGLPVLAISGDPDGRTPALEAGAVAFVDKPIPSVVGFLRLIRQLVAGIGAEPLGAEVAVPAGDPMALRDDLARAAALINARSADTIYARGFIRSLARAIGDEVLEHAALQSATEAGRQALAAILTERLTALDRVA